MARIATTIDKVSVREKRKLRNLTLQILQKEEFTAAFYRDKTGRVWILGVTVPARRAKALRKAAGIPALRPNYGPSVLEIGILP